jgi:hypothetical protein
LTNRNWTLAVNWAHVISECESVTGLTPSQTEIESALQLVEAEMDENELLSKEADELEEIIITRVLKMIRKNRGKEIKKAKPQKEENKADENPGNMDVQIFGPFGNMQNLKDMGFDLDPEVMKSITKGIMDNMFGKKSTKKKKKDGEEDDDEEDRSSSFYT